MKKLNILIILSLFLFVGIVDAKIVDKPLNISISNCFSVNITAEQTDGVLGDISFVGCDKIGDTHFYCNCLNKDNNNFSLIMRTDNAMVRNVRYYDIFLSVKYFETYKKTMSGSIEDGGDYYDFWNKSWIDRDRKVIIKEVPIYINTTIYEDKIIEVPKEIIIYVDRNITIQNITYVENTTRIEQMKQGQKEEGYFLGILIGIIIILIFIIYFKNNKIKELKIYGK